MVAAESICRGWGRAACSRSSSAHRVPNNASRLSAPATSAHSATFSASVTARQPSAAINAVPFVSASPSFASSVTGARPARRSASAPARRSPRNSASPSPMMTSAMCASGARSPDAPSDPWHGTTGWTPRSSMSSSRRRVCEADARMPLCQRVRADQHHGAHDRPFQRLAYAHRMRHHDVALQLAHLVGRDHPVLERAEAGRDAVDDPPLVDELLDRRHGPPAPGLPRPA